MLLYGLDEVGQLLYEVGQQIFADSHQGAGGYGRLGTRVELQLESIKIL